MLPNDELAVMQHFSILKKHKSTTTYILRMRVRSRKANESADYSKSESDRRMVNKWTLENAEWDFGKTVYEPSFFSQNILFQISRILKVVKTKLFMNKGYFISSFRNINVKYYWYKFIKFVYESFLHEKGELIGLTSEKRKLTSVCFRLYHLEIMDKKSFETEM